MYSRFEPTQKEPELQRYVEILNSPGLYKIIDIDYNSESSWMMIVTDRCFNGERQPIVVCGQDIAPLAEEGIHYWGHNNYRFKKVTGTLTLTFD